MSRDSDENDVLEIGGENNRRHLEVTHYPKEGRDDGPPQFVFVTHDTQTAEGVARSLSVRETRRLIRWLEQRLPPKRKK